MFPFPIVFRGFPPAPAGARACPLALCRRMNPVFLPSPHPRLFCFAIWLTLIGTPDSAAQRAVAAPSLGKGCPRPGWQHDLLKLDDL